MGILGTPEGLPAIAKGGVRTLLIPPELAFGEAGDGCLFGRSESCRIPPNSPVEITFRYSGTTY
jgi:peptidylprolyl isomerase